MSPSAKIDYLNIGLLFLSFAAAIIMPFELFLFSYAVLGPLHYITEISWLEQRNFFLKRKGDVFFLVIISFIVFLVNFMPEPMEHVFLAINRQFFAPGSTEFLMAVSVMFGGLTILSFFASYIFNKANSRWATYVWLIVCLYLIIVLYAYLPRQYKFMALMLPTIIHVCIFTGMFILSGALKQNTASSYTLFGLYVAVTSLFFCVDLSVTSVVTEYARTHYLASGFPDINRSLLALTGDEHGHDIFAAHWGRNIQAFIAFVYTYHYLNWFSKTGLTGWHNVSRPKLILFFGLWVGVLGIYAYDYKLGLSILFFFSFLHVVLEFPLNHKVGGQIIQDLRLRSRKMLKI